LLSIAMLVILSMLVILNMLVIHATLAVPSEVAECRLRIFWRLTKHDVEFGGQLTDGRSG